MSASVCTITSRIRTSVKVPARSAIPANVESARRAPSTSRNQLPAEQNCPDVLLAERLEHGAELGDPTRDHAVGGGTDAPGVVASKRHDAPTLAPSLRRHARRQRTGATHQAE